MSRLNTLFANVASANRRGRPLIPPVASPPPSSVSTDFDALYAGGFTLINDQTVRARPTVSRPSSKASSLATPSYTDSVYGTKIFRATDVADISGTTPWYNRHEYSRRSPFNCDNTRFITQVLTGHWHLYDATNFTKLAGGRTATPGAGALGLTDNTWWFTGDCEPVWHPTDPNIIRVTSQNGVGGIFYEFNIVTKTRTVLFSLMSRMAGLGFGATNFISFMGEGRPSDDHNRWALACLDSSSEMVGMIMYDLPSDTIIGSLATTNKPNNITTSPDGNYAVPSWSNGNDLTLTQARNASVNATNGTRSYTANFSSFIQISYYGEHADTGRDINGNPIYMSISYNSTKMENVSGGYIYSKRLDTESVTEYFRGDQNNSAAWHFAGHASTLRPGKFLISSYVGSTVSTWKDLAMMFLTAKTGTLDNRMVAHHQSLYSSANGDSYWTEPHATCNSDGTRVMFNSNYMTAPGSCESQLLGLPSWALN